MRREASIALIAQNVLFRDGLVRILNSSGFRISIESSTLNEDIIQTTLNEPSLVRIIEVDGTIEENVSSIQKFRSWHPSARVVVLADVSRILELAAMIQLGVNAFICRNANQQTFIKVLELILLGECFVPATVLQALAEQAQHCVARSCSAKSSGPIAFGEGVEFAQNGQGDFGQFSAQEYRILKHIVSGASNKLIARHMNIAEATVKVHVKTILRKLRVQNRTQAAIWAISHVTPSIPEVENVSA